MLIEKLQRQLVQRGRSAALQFELYLADRNTMITSLNDPLVERDLHRCVSTIEHATAAPEGCCKDGAQVVGAKSGMECLRQPACDQNALASVGSRDAAFPLALARGDQLHGGSGPDPHDLPPKGLGLRDIPIPDLHTDTKATRAVPANPCKYPDSALVCSWASQAGRRTLSPT